MIRPTSDRVRQTVFNVLGQWCEGFEVLDLFAGTGALAFEALSRGASRAVLVDSGKEAQALCRTNADALGFSRQIELLAMTAEKGLELLSKRGASFELIFADAPYKLRAGALVLGAVEAGRLLKPGGRVVIEHASEEVMTSRVEGLQVTDERAFGDTVVTIFELTGQGQ